MDKYTYQHSVNVAIISVVIGIGVKLPKPELLYLCIGSLLHDIGKVFIPNNIIKKPRALTSDRPYRKPIHPNDAVEYIMAYSGTLFDHKIVKVFSKFIIPYPIGTLVELSTSDICIVESNNYRYPLRPIVKIVKGISDEKNGNIIDLLYSLSIVITSVQYYYDNVNATINEGEMIAIIGTSGAGKSTLLNILELLDTQSDGDYILDGLNIKESSKKDLSKLRNKYFGFVVQHFALIKDYTVYENIEIPLEYARIKKKDRKENKQEGYGYFN